MDVDINEYRGEYGDVTNKSAFFSSLVLFPDLVVGDYKSQSVFVLRSRPVATINVTVTADIDEVLLTNYDCVDSDNRPIAWWVWLVINYYYYIIHYSFNIEVCAYLYW